MENKPLLTETETQLVESIKNIISQSRKTVVQKVNNELIFAYWKIGELIVLNEKNEGLNSRTSNQVILKLSKELTKQIGKGFSRSSLFNMRKFHTLYESVQTVSGQLSWSHISGVGTCINQLETVNFCFFVSKFEIR